MKSFVQLISILLILALTSHLKAQSYKTAIGLRLTNGYGLSINQLIIPDENVTLEGILQKQNSYNEGVLVSLLIEKHRRIISRNFNFYYGGGANLLFVDNTEKNNAIGASLITGIELSLGRLNFAADIKPNIYFSSKVRFFQPQIGISFRYIIAKREKINLFKD